MENIQLDAMDEKILQMLVENARIPFLEVARVCGVSGTAIHQRVQRLTSLGVLLGTEYKIDAAKIGYGTCAYIGLSLREDAQMEKVVDGLEHIPEVVECHCTNESYDLFVKVYARDNDHLLRLINEKLMPLGLTRSKIIISFRQLIRKQLAILPL